MSDVTYGLPEWFGPGSPQSPVPMPADELERSLWEHYGYPRLDSELWRQIRIVAAGIRFEMAGRWGRIDDRG